MRSSFTITFGVVGAGASVGDATAVATGCDVAFVSMTGAPTTVPAGTATSLNGTSQFSGTAPSLAQGMHLSTSVSSVTSDGIATLYTGFIAKTFCGYSLPNMRWTSVPSGNSKAASPSDKWLSSEDDCGPQKAFPSSPAFCGR